MVVIFLKLQPWIASLSGIIYYWNLLKKDSTINQNTLKSACCWQAEDIYYLRHTSFKRFKHTWCLFSFLITKASISICNSTIFNYINNFIVNSNFQFVENEHSVGVKSCCGKNTSGTFIKTIKFVSFQAAPTKRFFFFIIYFFDAGKMLVVGQNITHPSLNGPDITISV